MQRNWINLIDSRLEKITWQVFGPGGGDLLGTLQWVTIKTSLRQIDMMATLVLMLLAAAHLLPCGSWPGLKTNPAACYKHGDGDGDGDCDGDTWVVVSLR